MTCCRARTGAGSDGSDDERTGARIVLRALEEPLRQLAENAGLEGSVVVNDVRKAKKGQGLNAAGDEIVGPRFLGTHAGSWRGRGHTMTL